MTPFIRLMVALSLGATITACATAQSQSRPPAPTARATALPADYPKPLRGDIHIRKVAEVGPGMVRLVKDPGSNDLYYLSPQGDVFFLSPQPGREVRGALAYSRGEIGGAPYALGLAFGPDRALYVVGNESEGARNRCVIRKGVVVGGGRKWSTLVRTEWYAKSNTQYDHLCNAIVVSPDGQYVYFNSGSRTDHGEVQTAEGAFPGLREIPLTASVFRVPANAADLVLPNDEAKLKAGGYLFAAGLRNAFDLAFNAAGDLIAVDNGPDANYSDELNWLREGHHYGFPWRFGGEDNPRRFADYDPAKDKRLSREFVAVQMNLYRNDPAFPKPPMAFTDPILNFGPDADQFQGADGSVRDASDLGRPLSGLTMHRSPLGLAFDVDNRLGGDFKGAGFLLSWGAVGGPQTDNGQDLLLIRLTKAGNAYRMSAEQIVVGFHNPIDSALIGDKLYVLDYGGRGAIWEIDFP
ncbi:MAG: PQQ-dependent sugar dehydrogenase [Thermoflexales bacterium]|nr:PQQ-dependent sugar dehydrogenase [Thermoflexales bacterium]MDW8352633.1 PQQ-dependent sugar dehydrogenase [Anaerolineae bacterium]